MNSWGNEYNHMPNQFGMPMNPMMAPNMMGMIPNPMVMMPDMAPQMNAAPPPENPPLIGPVAPEGFVPGRNENTDNSDNQKKGGSSNQQPQHDKNQRGPNRNDNRRERDFRDRGDRGRRRSRSPHSKERVNPRNQPEDRNDRGRRDRRTKWDTGQNHPGMPDHGMNPCMNLAMNPGMNPAMGNMMLPGMMPPYNNNMMGQPPMDMQNAGNMANMPQMGAMGPMGNMHMGGMPGMPGMIPGMNMMPNMMDQNMMMMQQMQPMPMPNQPIFVADGVLLPPIPGSSTPNRRDKPPGCRTIFIGGLPSGIKQEVITEIFQRFGQIVGVKLHKQGVCHVRFEKHNSVEDSFIVTGWRFKFSDQTDNEATTLFIDYALNREDQAEFERNKRRREPTPPPVEMFSPQALVSVTEKIKNDEQFAEAAPTLAAWLERGECNKKNSNTFYSLIQASNNQTRRLFNEKMTLDEDLEKMKSQLREKFQQIIAQFEYIAKILTAAKHQRVSDHFTKQQRRNIEMWLKMTENENVVPGISQLCVQLCLKCWSLWSLVMTPVNDGVQPTKGTVKKLVFTKEVENMKEEFNALFDDEESEKPGKNSVPLEKYEQLKQENENLQFELEGYKNEAYLAKDEAERKFEKFKAHYIAQNALLNSGQKLQGQFPPMPPPPMPSLMLPPSKPQPPPPLPEDDQSSGKSVAPSEAKLISILTAFLLVHPLGATLDYLASYVRSLLPSIPHVAVHNVLRKYSDVFHCVSSGPVQQQKWTFVTFDIIKKE